MLYEFAMTYDIDGMREHFWKEKNAIQNIDDEDLRELGWTADDIAGIKGTKDG